MKEKIDSWFDLAKLIVLKMFNTKKPWQFFGMIFMICFLALLITFYFSKSMQSLIFAKENIEVQTAQPNSVK